LRKTALMKKDHCSNVIQPKRRLAIEWGKRFSLNVPQRPRETGVRDEVAIRRSKLEAEVDA